MQSAFSDVMSDHQDEYHKDEEPYVKREFAGWEVILRKDDEFK